MPDKQQNEKPNNIKEYKKWLKDEHKVDISKKTETYYKTVTNTIKEAFEKSELWQRFNDQFRVYDEKFLVESKGYNLWANYNVPIILYSKSFDSFLLKTFRKNIHNNQNWPESPKDGWYLPDNWFSRINDIVRTVISVKYLDGVEFVVELFKNFSEEYGFGNTVDYEAKEEGYYAAHIYVDREYEIPHIDWDTLMINAKVEIQITTQLQEVIRKLLHKYYEDHRKEFDLSKQVKWQWDYRNNEFATNYLGHILHYLEGMIMEIRERLEESKHE